MAFNVYHNPQNVTLGDTAIKGVESIATSCRYEGADSGRTSGSITLLDPEVADAIAGEKGTMCFTWKGNGGAITITLRRCGVGGYDKAASHGPGASITLPFIAESAPNAGKAREKARLHIEADYVKRRTRTRIRVWVGPDADHLGLCGTLMMRHGEAAEFLLRDARFDKITCLDGDKLTREASEARETPTGDGK